MPITTVTLGVSSAVIEGFDSPSDTNNKNGNIMFSRKKSSTNKIEFLTRHHRLEGFSGPRPSSKVLPSWLKGLSKFVDSSNFTGMTVKSCMPFLDAMTSGYVITAATDMTLRGWTEGKEKHWQATWNVPMEVERPEFVTSHDVPQMGNEPAIKSGSLPLKMRNFFCIKTPEGYSSLIVPVLNNQQLPMMGITFLSAVVDTDTYNNEINFPFLFSNFTGEDLFIEKGTPLVQVIPFKRENWEMEKSGVDGDYYASKDLLLGSRIVDSYRKIFHKKKTYL